MVWPIPQALLLEKSHKIFFERDKYYAAPNTLYKGNLFTNNIFFYMLAGTSQIPQLSRSHEANEQLIL